MERIDLLKNANRSTYNKLVTIPSQVLINYRELAKEGFLKFEINTEIIFETIPDDDDSTDDLIGIYINAVGMEYNNNYDDYILQIYGKINAPIIISYDKIKNIYDCFIFSDNIIKNGMRFVFVKPDEPLLYWLDEKDKINYIFSVLVRIEKYER